MVTQTQPIDPQFKQMLSILHHGGAYGHWWNKHPQTGSRATEWFPVSEPTAPTNGIVDAYFGVHPTITIPPVNRHNEPATPENVRSQIRYIAAINCLFGEYDAKNYDNGKQGALEHIESIEPSPSIIVDSGGGYHVYWLLNATWPLNDGEDRQEAKDIQARWVDYVGSDKDAKDLARVLRVPGTHNLKYAHKPTVTFVKFEPKLQYELDYLCSFLTPAQKPQETPTAPITLSVDTDSVRLSAYLTRALNDEIAHVATVQTDKHFNLRDAAIRVGSLIPHGLNEDEAFNALYNAISGRAKDTRNAADTIRDGFEYGKKEPRKIEDKFKAEQPDFRADGTALCPTHKTPLVKAFSGNGYRCDDEPTCFWWKGEGYVPPSAVQGFEGSERITEHTPIVFEEDEIQPLPYEIDFSLGKGAGRWLDLYVDYASQVSPQTPRSFHETAALWLMSVAIARRVYVKMSFADILPNLFVLWVARSTIWSKTTAMNVATRLAEKTFRHLLGPQDMTPEALYADMCGKEPPNIKEFNDTAMAVWKAERDFSAQRGFAWDEISGFLAKSQKEYNAGLIEAFLKFYDCSDYKGTTKGGGRVWVRNSYVSVLGASTPVMMQQHFQNSQLANNGWWQRFIIVTPEGDKPEYSRNEGYVREPPHLQSWLHNIYARLPMPSYPDVATPVELELSDDVMQVWGQYDKAMRSDLQDDNLSDSMSSTYSRFSTLSIKVATILATMDWGENMPQPVIRVKHMVRAIEFCEQWRRSLHKVMGTSVASVERTIRDRILKQVAKYDEQGGLKVSDLSRLMKDVDYSKLKIAILECVDLGLIEKVETPAKGDGRGRNSVRYRLLR